MKTFISADQLIDGTGSPPIENAVVEVESGKIVAIHTGNSAAQLASVEIQNFPGCTILPGLIDTHVHLNLPGDGTLLEVAMRESEGVLTATSMANAARALSVGITTVRDVGAYKTTAIDVRRAIDLGYATGSRIVACGPPLTITGGHTWYFGGEADGEVSLRKKVRELVKQGADFIKVMGSGGGTLGTASWRPSYSLEELRAITDEAHRNERKVAVHCLCADSIIYAIEAGVDQIEHAGFIINAAGEQQYDPNVAERLARSGIPVTSTLAVGGTAVNAMLAKHTRSKDEDIFLSRWQHALLSNVDQFRKLRDAGVEFVAGTDSGWRFTSVDSLVLELELMQCGGYSTMDAIVSATRRAAEVIGIGDSTGLLKAGLDADIIAVEGNPLDNLDALRDLRLVLQRGEPQLFSGRQSFFPQAKGLPADAAALAHRR